MPGVNAWAALQTMQGAGVGFGLLVGFAISIPLLAYALFRDHRADRLRDERAEELRRRGW